MLLKKIINRTGKFLIYESILKNVDYHFNIEE